MPALPPADPPVEVYAECAEWLIVIGGNAVQSYGMDRMTYDSDCAILDRDEPRLREALGRIGYIVDDHKGTFIRYVHLGRRRPVVDTMLLDADTFAKLFKESCFKEILGRRVRVPTPLHLVAMKLHSLKQQPDRAYKDWPDIRHLLETNRGSWTAEELKSLVERYASEEVAEQLRQGGFL